jgi:DNA ligase (NAD+)
MKWESQKATTTLKSIIISMGHTGAIIPTGELEPIEVGGVTISHVLLNNYDYIKELDLTIGCQIEIERAGDVIPHISSVLTKTQNPIMPPINCFSCNTVLIKKGVNYLCENPSCQERNYQKIKSYITKRNIKFLGEEILRTIYQREIIKEITDLYNLNKDDLINLPCGKGIIGERRTNTILNEIEKSKKCPLNELFGCLGIPFLGRRQAEIMMSFGINTTEKFQNLTVEQLSSFEGFGTNGGTEIPKSVAIIQGIKKEEKLIQNLLKILQIPELNKKDHQFSNKSFCFTGIRMNQEQKKKFQEIGAIEKGSVSKNLDYLVVKSENSTSDPLSSTATLVIIPIFCELACPNLL